MSQPPIPSPFDSLRSAKLGGAVEPWVYYVAEGATLTALGVVAIIVPAITSLVIEMFIGWLLLVMGCFRFIAIIRRWHTPGFWQSLIASVIAVVLGGLLIIFPLGGMLTLTLALMIMFIVEGVMSILTAVDFRKHTPNWGLPLISGVIDLILAFLIYYSWPGSGVWFIGLLVGVYMIFTGLSLAFTALAAHSATSAKETAEQAPGAGKPSGMPKGAAPTT
jgi:uncharacterized membrane protein HdeD (DUF308 family)